MTNWASGQLLHDSKYRIENDIDNGGFGITYRAVELATGNLVAIKTLKNEHKNRRDFSKLHTKFVNEALFLARCNHPHVVKVSEVFEQGGFWHIVMEFIEGITVIQYLQNVGAIPEAESLAIIKPIGEALSYIHTQGFNHRDIKPDNIMLRQSNSQPVLIDFGLAKPLTESSLKTNTFNLTGTPFYAPIEQYKSFYEKTVVAAYSDVYSLAASLYAMVTGKRPTPADFRYENGLPLPSPKDYNPEISDSVNAAILKGMELLPENRPQTMQEWLEMLFPNVPPLPRGARGDEDDLSSEKGMDYRPLQALLKAQKWREADKETARVMLVVAGREEEGWLDRDSIKNFPCTDLRTIDQLWVKYSNGRFGFSVESDFDWPLLLHRGEEEVKIPQFRRLWVISRLQACKSVTLKGSRVL